MMIYGKNAAKRRKAFSLAFDFLKTRLTPRDLNTFTHTLAGGPLAFDGDVEKPDNDLVIEWFAQLVHRLTPEHRREIARILTADLPATDVPPPFEGRPLPGGTMDPMDLRATRYAEEGAPRAAAMDAAAAASFSRTFPEAARLIR